MSEEVLINISPMETRVALVENGALQEVFIEREARRGIVGNIYKGKVVRVLPGMQAAFVDAGLERAAFIHAADIAPARGPDEGETPSDSAVPTISELTREGDPLVVQVTKDPIGTKGARLTTHISIPSRYLVLMPETDHIGISQRIEDETERTRLREIVERARDDEPGPALGFIVRTAAEGVSEAGISSDVRFLLRLWKSLRSRMENFDAPSSIHMELPLYKRAIRDLVGPNVEKIRIDSQDKYAEIESFACEYVPEVADRLEPYPGERPILDLFGVEDEIERALDRKVQLKSGGHIVIDQTEAMTTIDVNTGAFVGRRNLEETIFKTNLEAATTLVRQLRLRNLGGIVIIDFIDMQDPEHQRQVLRTLEKALEKDHAKTKVTTLSDLGLVEMTRKRTRESLGQLLCETCNVCHGRGQIKTAETVCYEIFRDILREARAYGTDTYLVLASQSVVDRLLDEESTNLADLEAFIGKTVRIQVEAMYSQEQFDVVLL